MILSCVNQERTHIIPGPLQQFVRRQFQRVRPTPKASRYPPLGPEYRYNDDPEYGGPNEYKGQEPPFCQRRIDDLKGGHETHVHKHRDEQAFGTVIDPYH
jgi:hypothetical protein